MTGARLIPRPLVPLPGEPPVSVSLRQKAARGVMVVAVLKVLGTTVARISQLLLPLYLLPADFGLFALAAFFSGVLLLVGELGISTYLVRLKDRFEESADTAFALRLIMATALLIFSIILGWAASILYSEPRLVLPTIVLSIGLFLNALSMVPRVLALRSLDFARAAVPDNVGRFTGSLGTLGLAILGFAYWSPVYGSIAGLALGTSLQIAVTRWKPRLRLDPQTAKDIVRFGQYVTMALFASFIAHSVDNAIIGLLLGVSALGFYTVAYSWGVYFVSNLAALIASVSYPFLSHVANAPERLRRVFSENIRYYSLLSMCLGLGVATLAPLFVRSFYGDVWVPTILPMQILSFVGLLLGYATIASDALYTVGKPKLVSIILWSEAVVLLVVLPPATLLGGITGTSLAALGGAAFASVALAVVASRELGIGIATWVKPLAKPLEAGILASLLGAIVSVLVLPSILSFVIVLAVYLGSYVGALQLLTKGRFLADMKELLRLAIT